MNRINRRNDLKIHFYQKQWFYVVLSIFFILISVFAFLLWKANSTLSRVSIGSDLFSSIVHMVPGVNGTIKGEETGRINFLLLGMRGKGIEGGEFLADTIMVVSFKPLENKIGIISIPRDLYVTVPGETYKRKINSVHSHGESKSSGQGLNDMRTVVSEIIGQEIHYATSINFKGFMELIDALGGITVHLDAPFVESKQFQQAHVCDGQIFTEPTGEFEIKKNKNGKEVARYPLCLNKELECGGVFELPEGDVNLDGENALCYVRSRFSTNDFDRARRQQEVISAVKNKALQIGTLADFGKINNLFSVLGGNVRSDMQLWEMQRAFELYRNLTEPVVSQKVLEDSQEGLLYVPPITDETGYILLPRGDNYDKIHELFEKNI